MTTQILVIDMLKDFCAEGGALYLPHSRKIIPDIVSLLKEKGNMYGSWWHDNIIYVCDWHPADDIEFEEFPPHCIKGTAGSELIDELYPIKGTVINKVTFDGFSNPNLERDLKLRKATELIIVGVCTDICILHTAKSAVELGYSVTIPKNCVAPLKEGQGSLQLATLEIVHKVRII